MHKHRHHMTFTAQVTDSKTTVTRKLTSKDSTYKIANFRMVLHQPITASDIQKHQTTTTTNLISISNLSSPLKSSVQPCKWGFYCLLFIIHSFYSLGHIPMILQARIKHKANKVVFHISLELN